MAATRDRPHVNSNFRVELGSGDSRTGGTGFAEVVFPPFMAEGRNAGRRPVAPTGAPAAGDEPAVRHLVLRRGATGALDLYAWWDRARKGEAPARRVLKVKLLAEDHATVVMTWRFRNVRPVSLTYSPLRAMEGGILMETLELAFDDVEMS